MEGKPPISIEFVDLTTRQIDELRADVERLKDELEQAGKAAKRQAAFSFKCPSRPIIALAASSREGSVPALRSSLGLAALPARCGTRLTANPQIA